MFSITVTEKGGEQRRLDFDKPEITIGRVQGNDVILVRNAQFQPPGAAGYSVMLDVNGSGSILGGDVILVRNRQFTLLPDGEPTPPPAPLASLSEVVEPVVTPDETPAKPIKAAGRIMTWMTKKRLKVIWPGVAPPFRKRAMKSPNSGVLSMISTPTVVAQ